MFLLNVYIGILWYNIHVESWNDSPEYEPNATTATRECHTDFSYSSLIVTQFLIMNIRLQELLEKLFSLIWYLKNSMNNGPNFKLLIQLTCMWFCARYNLICNFCALLAICIIWNIFISIAIFLALIHTQYHFFLKICQCCQGPVTSLLCMWIQL